jgi:hypothetical protein
MGEGAVSGNAVEINNHGKQTDGKVYGGRGVTLSRSQADQITWMRLYFEPGHSLIKLLR